MPDPFLSKKLKTPRPRHLVGVLLALAACAEGPAPREAASPAAAPPPEVLEIARSRWVAVGRDGACGLSWAFDLYQDGARISGRLLLEDLQYDLRGRIDGDGLLDNIRGGKAPAFKGALGPRYVRVTLAFDAREAAGHYELEGSGAGETCRTEVRLKRYADE